MNSEKYKNILETHLLPTLQSCFPDGDGIFQQDLAPCHASNKMKKYLKKLRSMFLSSQVIPLI